MLDPCLQLPARLGLRGAIERRAVGVALLLILCLSTGCGLRQWARNGFKLGPNYVEPPAPVAPSYIDSANEKLSMAPACDCGWWAVFNDPTLNMLVENAYRQNLDLQIAGARILEARAQRNIAVGNLFPQSQSAMAVYAHGQVTENINVPIPAAVNIWATGFNASWELDFWGRYRRSVESANATWHASVEDYGDTLVMLFSEVATAYVQLRTFEERLEFARRNVEIQRGSTKLAEDRFNEGVATELDVRQARTNLTQTESAIPPLEAGRRQAANRLCILMGMPVTDLASEFGPAPIPKAPPQLAVGVPADLLRRRPDIRRAERQVAAQSAQIGVAQADLYPRLSIGGFLGYAADDIQRLFESRSFTAFILPTVQWNVLNYGRIANNIVVQDARLQQNALRYQQAVLSAGREVEDALIGFLQAQLQAARLEQSVKEADRSVELVLIQFEGGVVDFNRVFNVQSVLVSQQDQLAVTRGDIALNLIRAYKGLGGSWQHFAAGCGFPAAPAVQIISGPNGASPEHLPPVKPTEAMPQPQTPVSPPPDSASSESAPLPAIDK